MSLNPDDVIDAHDCAETLMPTVLGLVDKVSVEKLENPDMGYPILEALAQQLLYKILERETRGDADLAVELFDRFAVEFRNSLIIEEEDT